MTQEDRKMTREQDGEPVRGEVPPEGTEVGRRPTGAPRWGSRNEGLAQGQRWTAPGKCEVVLRILRGEPLQLRSRESGVEFYRLEKWRDAALAGMEEALKARGGAPSRQSWTTPCSAWAS